MFAVSASLAWSQPGPGQPLSYKGPPRDRLEEADTGHSGVRILPAKYFHLQKKMSVAGDHESFLTGSALCMHTNTNIQHSTMENITSIVRLLILTGHTQMQLKLFMKQSAIFHSVTSYPGHTKALCKCFVFKIRYNLVLFRLECRLCLVVNLIYNAFACNPDHGLDYYYEPTD